MVRGERFLFSDGGRRQRYHVERSVARSLGSRQIQGGERVRLVRLRVELGQGRAARIGFLDGTAGMQRHGQGGQPDDVPGIQIEDATGGELRFGVQPLLEVELRGDDVPGGVVGMPRSPLGQEVECFAHVSAAT